MSWKLSRAIAEGAKNARRAVRHTMWKMTAMNTENSSHTSPTSNDEPCRSCYEYERQRNAVMNGGDNNRKGKEL